MIHTQWCNVLKIKLDGVMIPNLFKYEMVFRGDLIVDVAVGRATLGLLLTLFHAG